MVAVRIGPPIRMAEVGSPAFFNDLRLYGPLEPWFNKTWRPGEIEIQP